MEDVKELTEELEELTEVEAEVLPKEEKAKLPKQEKVKVQKVKKDKTQKCEKAQKIKEAITGFHAQCGSSGLGFSILSLIFTFFVLVVSLSVKAQTGVLVVFLLVILVIYMFVLGLIGLAIAIYSLVLTSKKLNETKSLIGFILSILSIAIVAGSICVVYLA